MALGNFTVQNAGLTPTQDQSVLSSNYLQWTDPNAADFSSFAQQYLPELYEQEVERFGNRTLSGFLRMVTRSSRLNATSYSLSSLFSVGSVNCGSTMSGAISRQSARGSTAGGKRNGGGIAGSALWQGPSSLKALYK